MPEPVPEQLSLDARAPGRPLRIVLVAFYNYEAHALRIFAPLLRRRGHEVHSIFFKNYFTYSVPTTQEEDMVVELIERIRPDLVAMSVWSTYYQLAARLSRRIKEAFNPVVIWGGIHPQTRPRDCVQHADVVCLSEGEYVPFECTFCIHNFTRKASEGLGTYVRRRSVDHVMEELRAAVRLRPGLRTIAFSDDIFAPSRPWLEEFCARYKREIGLPWAIWSFPRMVDDHEVRLMRDAGLWATTIGIQSGSERIRRDSYERETSNEEIIAACETFARYGVVRNLDFIGDNPYEDESDRRQTIELLSRLPKPFFFNYFTLTYFPGVDLTERALRDGFIGPDDVEDVAEKGYHFWGGALLPGRTPEELRWDVAYTLAVHGVPRRLLFRLLDSPAFTRSIHGFAELARQVRRVSRWKIAVADRVTGRPNLLRQYFENTNRDAASGEDLIQPNFDASPFSQPMRAPLSASGG